KQIKSLGKGIDWSRELATSDSYYYKWTHWIRTVSYLVALIATRKASTDGVKALHGLPSSIVITRGLGSLV
ncbi:MAG: hypothetical protein Q8853_02780, partial [Candidatus Phytoplasma australasiaticum]|nr:hypothetical protein [Candidatus Phytoplasma australasiaticum]